MRGDLLPAASAMLDRNELFFDKGAQSTGICSEVDVKLCAGRFALQIENTGTVIDMKLHECKQAGFGGREVRIDDKCRNVRAEAGFLLLSVTVAVYLLPSQYIFIVVEKLDELLEAKEGIV